MDSNNNVSNGIGFGSLLAFYISGWIAHNTIGWMVLHAIFGWFYVIYYFLVW